MPYRIAPTGHGSSCKSSPVAPGPGRARFKRVDMNETGTSTTYYIAGGSHEVVTTGTTVTHKTYIGGAAVVIEVTLPRPSISCAATWALLASESGSGSSYLVRHEVRRPLMDQSEEKRTSLDGRDVGLLVARGCLPPSSSQNARNQI